MKAGICNLPRPAPGGLGVPRSIDAFAHRMTYSIAKDQRTASEFDVYPGLAFAVPGRLMERWFKSQSAYFHQGAKRVHY